MSLLRVLLRSLVIGYWSLVISSLLPAAEYQASPDTLQRLAERARQTQSSAVVVLKHGQPLLEWYASERPEKIEAMSVTKSVVFLAIARLITDGRISGFDAPVYEFYPEWKQGRKASITLRHLMNHTSGLQNVPDTTGEIYPAPDFVKLALAAELTSDPGAVFSYNNKAVNLLAGIVQIASGQRLDLYLKDQVFAPLGITDFSWSLDKAGNPHAMSGLQILPRDLAKLGQLMLARGTWDGRALIKPELIAEATSAAQSLNPVYGLLWWLKRDKVRIVFDSESLARFRKLELPPDFSVRAEKLIGTYESAESLTNAFRSAFSESDRDQIRKKTPSLDGLVRIEASITVTRYEANGYLGQYLVVCPDTNIVAVRMIKASSARKDGSTEFTDFGDLVGALR